MAFEKFKNFAQGTLNADITADATSFTLQSGQGDKFPDSGNFRLVIWGQAYASPEADPDREIVLGTGRTGDTINISRNPSDEDNYTNKAWSAGDKVALVWTNGALKKITDQDLKTSDSPTFAGLTVDTDTLYIDSTNHRVGIGTTGPGYKFEVNGDIGIMSGILQTTPAPDSDIKSIVNREYVDSAVTSLGASYYMTDDTDGDTGYKVCSLDPPDGNEAYIEDTIITERAISGAVWISKSGEEPAKLLRGIYGFFIEVEKTGGTKGVRLYWKMYELKSDQSTVLIGTSTHSDLIETDRGSYIVPLKLNEDYKLSAGSRVYGEFWAIPEGGGSDPTIKIYYQGDTSSRWDVPANSEIFKNIFVPYTGATQDVDLGSYGLTVNDLTIGSLSGVLKASSGVVSGGATQDDLPDGTIYKQYNPANVAITGGTIDGISVSNLLDKSANETITGIWTFQGTSPYLKLLNTTQEDTDGGRESSVKFYGKKSTGETDELARIEASHEGSGADYKGKLDFYTTNSVGSYYSYARIKTDGCIEIGTPNGSAIPGFNFLSKYYTYLRSYGNYSGTNPSLCIRSYKGRGSSLTSPTVVSNGDSVFSIEGYGYDGTSPYDKNHYIKTAEIRMVIDGTPGVNDMPGRIEFYTTPDGSVTPALALTLDSSQNATFAGKVDATHFGGIASANLLDKSADETITGKWTHNVNYTTSSALSYTGFHSKFHKRIQGNITDYGIGLKNYAFATIDSGYTDNGYLQSLLVYAYRNYYSGLDDSGTLDKLYGIRIAMGHDNNNPSASPTTNILYGINIHTACQTGSIGTAYGLKINDMAGTTKYAIYTGTGSVSLGDKLYVRGLTQQSAGGLTVEYDTTTKELYAETSGAKFKKNIKNLFLDPSNLLNLKLKSWIDKETGRPEFGYLADDLAEIYPQAVIFAPDFKKVVKKKEQKIKHEDGTEEVIPAEYEEVPIEGTEKPVGIKMTKLPILAIELIKKQQKEIEALKKKIKALEK